MSAARRDGERHGSGPRVLLLWPGGLFQSGANFGVPQLLSMAGVLQARAGAQVDVVDLDMERAFGPVRFERLADAHYDVVGISCYSSYDYLKVMAIATGLRSELPQACFVTGGYHPSAVPEDFSHADSPFDHVIVGDGEAALLRLVQSLARGETLAERVLTPEPWTDLDGLERYDWSLLERYRPIARQVAAQAEIYLSRGCPHRCAFCMEGAKRETAWRSLSPARAVEELHGLDQFLDLSQWTVFVTDALFGLRASWRRAFLEGLARRPIRARKLWLLTRADGLERDDLELMARANVAPGFGLESGDATQLGIIHKTSRVEAYLDHMMSVARWALELDVPFGANVIVGHPGETEQSMRRSAAYLKRLFLGDSRGTTGFLSVDPFRLYPGSPIAAELESWQRSTGMSVHRYPWWQDGDQDFLAEWVDPSAELDFRRTLQLRRELFDPILLQLGERFAYRGPARQYFQKAIDEQVALTAPERTLHTLGLWHLWRGLLEEPDRSAAPRTVAADEELGELAETARAKVLAERDWPASPRLLAALHQVPRERFVRLEDMGQCADDRALPLSEDGRSTLSAMHAYAAAFEALDLAEGDTLVELGGGNGYGAALASEVVGPTGRVLSLELDGELAEQAQLNLSGYGQTELITGDAHDVERWRPAAKIYVAFAVAAVPPQWLAALELGGALVAPIGRATEQVLTRFEKTADGVREVEIGPVRYVVDRQQAS